jgi:hypothetical protein
MKNSFSPINLAVDSVAIYMSFFSWLFIVWIPVFLIAVIFFVAKVPAPTSFVALLIFSMLLMPLGILLKWLADGIIQRKWARMGLSVLVLGFLSIKLGFSPPHVAGRLTSTAFERSVVGIGLLSAALVLALGFAMGARHSDE